MSNKLKKISLQTYEKNSKGLASAPLFLLNTTGQNKSAGRPKGDILLAVTLPTGKTEQVFISSVVFPVEVTQFAPRAAWLECSDFKKLLAKGHLAIIDEESAESFMAASKIARDQYLKTYGIEWVSSKDDVLVESDEDESNEMYAESELESGLADIIDTLPTAHEVLSLELEGKEEAALNVIDNRGTDSEPEDIKYIAENSNSSKIKERATEFLSMIETLEG